MMKEEFEELIGGEMNSADYRIIEYVYMYHPVIDPVSGKKQIADLYKLGGMSVIKGMVYIAKRAEGLEKRMREVKRELADLQQEMQKLRFGQWRVDIELPDDSEVKND